jgi:hypothetical protein
MAHWLALLPLCVAAVLNPARAEPVDVFKLPPPASRSVNFVEDIQPILARSCYDCHGPEKQENSLRWDLKSSALKGGVSGPAIVAGNSSRSRMIHLVAGLEKGLVMPQKGERLTAAQIGLLRAWIDQGAHWPDDDKRGTRNTQQGTRDHWAFKTALRQSIPDVKGKAWPRNPVDYFVLARLEQEKLSPSAEADRVTLIRRLTYDLTGLPPTPEEVQRFVSDPSKEAYELLVDRLLASPRYGERWARHWLDVVHFGETHGYDKDKLRTNAWPYRDYVIGSFNEDKPYSRFVQEQIAGDVLFSDEPDGVVATGFIAAGPWDYVGHVELPVTKTDGLIARYNDRDDMVMTTMSTFQSLTVHCARCHDHKFDPITQQDYYRLQAVFAGVDRAARPYDLDRETHRRRRSLLAERKPLEARQAELKAAFAKVTSPELQRLDEQLAAANAKLGLDAKSEKKSPSNGYHSGIEPKPDAPKWVQVDLGRSVSLDELRLIPARPTDFSDRPGFGFPVRFRVEISNDAAFTNGESIVEHTAADFKNPGDAPFVIDVKGQAARYVRVTATRLWERTKDYVFALGELQAFASGTNVARRAEVTSHDSIEAGRWARKYLVDGYSSRGRLSDIALTADELARRKVLEDELKKLETEREAVFEKLLDPALKATSAGIEARLAAVDKKLASLPAPLWVYAAANDFKADGTFVPANGVRPVHLLVRGDVQRPKQLMLPAGLPAVPGPDCNFQLDQPDDEGARRAALAKWITDPKNMLTRRSIVNRVWQYHFGKGIVDTPNDFGHMGAMPTHPELLDWLAFWFFDNGESLKKLHKLLLTSATYRQSSANQTEYARSDGDNRYLWRMTRARLDAESMHDAILFVSGKLDFTMGGPSVRQFYYKSDHSPIYDYTRFDVDGPGAYRRSIYRHLVRSVTDPFMDCLDCADPSLLVPKRNTTLTALQALATLNNPFVVRQSAYFAARLQQMSSDRPRQIETAYRLALSRRPTPQERDRLVSYAREHDLASACRVLFNCSEFCFID